MEKDFLTMDFQNDAPKKKEKFSPKVLAETHQERLPAKTGTVDDLIHTLKDIILEDIERVKNNKDYVHQAKAVNNHVNSVINLARLQYDMLKR